MPQLTAEERVEVDAIKASTSENPVPTTLQTDARVIARVTDGIYRQPASALRELISNAYDADAQIVTISTDRPRFRLITVEDDGVGMTPEVLWHLLHHIGGSVKRTRAGIDYEVTKDDDPNRSRAGRPLIGKIGIGLFSVSQLTQSFQIITKVAGDEYHTVARVKLRTYSDTPEADEDGKFEAGLVHVWREPAHNKLSHGTTIVLDAIRPQTIETLRSKNRWDAVHASIEELSARNAIQAPRFHIGSVEPEDEGRFREYQDEYTHLPWTNDDSPGAAFQNLVNGVWGSLAAGQPNPSIDKLCDYYLKMVWQLSLWAPLPYLGPHPFLVPSSDLIDVFAISADARHGRKLETGCSAQDGTIDVVQSHDLDFRVIVDDLELARPIDVQRSAFTSAAVGTPNLFVGEVDQRFTGTPEEISGGPLRFQAYLLWTPKVVPTEHQGVLVRVHNASGSSFDETFIDFPVREQTRLPQISCEIYIMEGFDGALNIDRESFNFAHPHAVVVTRWLHAALRYVIAEQKRRASTSQKLKRQAKAGEAKGRGADVVAEVWDETSGGDGTPAPTVVFSDRSERTEPNQYHLPETDVLGSFVGRDSNQRRDKIASTVENLLQVVAAFGGLDGLSDSDVQKMATALRKIVQAYE